MLAICERFAWCRCLKLRQSAFTAQIDRHIVREEIDRDDAVVLAAIGVARLDRWRQHHLHVLGRIILRPIVAGVLRSEEHTSELQSLMRISYAVFCLKKKT